MGVHHAHAGAGSDGIIAAEQFMQLVSMLLEPLPDDLKQRMNELLVPLAKLAPDYATFRATTKSCLLLEELASYQPNRVRPQLSTNSDTKTLSAQLRSNTQQDANTM